MNYIDRYVHRLGAKGESLKETILNKSKRIANEKFSTSPSHYVVSVDDYKTDAIIFLNKDSNELDIHFRPDATVNVGSIVNYRNNNYLLIDFYENEIHPKGKLRLCNSTFPIESDKTHDLLKDEDGNIVVDDYGEPIVIESGGDVIYEPCIVEKKYYFNNRNEQITLPEDRVMVTLKYQEADSIAVNKEFNIYDTRFAIKDIDYTKVINGVGIMTITGERVMDKKNEHV